MSHDAMKDKLFALHDGELTGAARREVEAHLDGCTECRAIYERWTRTSRALFRVAEPRASEAFVDRVLDRIAGSEPRHWTAPWVVDLRWLVPAVGLAVLLVLVSGPKEPRVSVDALLLEDGREGGSAQLMLAQDTPSSEEVLGFVMEGQP